MSLWGKIMHRRDALKAIAGTALAAALPLPVMAAKTPVIMVQHPSGCPCPACRPDLILTIEVFGNDGVPNDPVYNKWSDTYYRVHDALKDVRLYFPEASYIRITNPKGFKLCCEKWATGWIYELYSPNGTLYIPRKKFTRNPLFKGSHDSHSA